MPGSDSRWKGGVAAASGSSSAARASAAGSAMAVVLFLGTLSFLITTPNLVMTHYDGLPVLGALPGQFLLKDLVLIGVALWSLGDALGASARRDTTTLV